MSMPLIVGVSGNRRTGKDTLFTSLHTLDSCWLRKAFADRLKADVAPLIRDQFGYDPDNLTPEQKEACRHIYIGYGMAWRAIDPFHWVNVISKEIDELRGRQLVAVVDFRFANEVESFRSWYGSTFKLVNLTREDAPPPTNEEEKHYRQVAAMADYNISWGNDTPEQQLEHARKLMAWLQENS